MMKKYKSTMYMRASVLILTITIALVSTPLLEIADAYAGATSIQSDDLSKGISIEEQTNVGPDTFDSGRDSLVIKNQQPQCKAESADIDDLSESDRAKPSPEDMLDSDIVESTPKKAQSSTVIDSGDCGDENSSITWSLTNDGTLTLNGSGSLQFYELQGIFEEASFPPWYSRRESIKSVVVGKGITSLSQNAFTDCINLTSVTLNEGLKDIGNSTFRNTGLRELRLPDSLAKLDPTAFLDLDVQLSTSPSAKLKIVNNVVFSRDGKTLYLYIGNGESSYDIPAGVNTIKEYAFACRHITSITIPSTVNAIEFRAFAASDLESIEIPDSVTELGGGICANCFSLRHAVIGNKVPELDGTFDWCYSLETCQFGSEVKRTDGTFRGCSALHDIVLPEGLQEIGWATFYDCESLKSIQIPDSVTKIGSGAFYDSGISSIVVPKSVTSIGSDFVNDGVKVTIENKDLIPDENGEYTLNNRLAITGKNDYQSAVQVLTLVNKERKAKGLNTLKMDQSLMESAMKRAAETVILFSHGRPNGKICFTINNLAFAENIAYGSTTAKGVMSQWMNSTVHKNNILNKDAKSIGIGCFIYNGIYYWVQLFGDSKTQSEASASGKKTVDVPIDIAIKDFRDPDTGEKVHFSFRIDPKTISGFPGESTELKLKLGSVTFKSSSVRWSSSNNKVASIDKNGEVKLKSEGNCNIVAGSAGGSRAKATVSVYSNKYSSVEQMLTRHTGEGDVKVACFSKLRLHSKSAGSKSISLSWKRLKNAKKYVVYGTKCGKKSKLKKICTTSKQTKKITKIAGKKLKKGKYYRFVVIALDRNNRVVSVSKGIHVATSGGKAGNHKSVSIKKKVLNKLKKMKRGKSIRLNAKAVPASSKVKVKKHISLRYESTAPKIATVSKSGRITCHRKGSCYIYAFGQNGVYKRVKITVQ